MINGNFEDGHNQQKQTQKAAHTAVATASVQSPGSYGNGMEGPSVSGGGVGGGGGVSCDHHHQSITDPATGDGVGAVVSTTPSATATGTTTASVSVTQLNNGNSGISNNATSSSVPSLSRPRRISEVPTFNHASQPTAAADASSAAAADAAVGASVATAISPISLRHAVPQNHAHHHHHSHQQTVQLQPQPQQTQSAASSPVKNAASGRALPMLATSSARARQLHKLVSRLGNNTSHAAIHRSNTPTPQPTFDHPHAFTSSSLSSLFSSATATTSIAATTTTTTATSLSLFALPPVNLSTLAELRLDGLLRNAQLRHDVVLDERIEFRQRSGRRAADHEFWSSLEREVRNGRFDAPTRLSVLIREIREILCVHFIGQGNQALQNEVRESIDTGLVARQARHGVLDLAGLMQYIGHVMMQHCAPIRDADIQAIVHGAAKAASIGYATRDGARAMLAVLRQTYSVLEKMALDLANHYVRTLRPQLIVAASQFEQSYFATIMEQTNTVPNAAIAWWRDLPSTATLADGVTATQAMAYRFNAHASRLITSQQPIGLPETFKFDAMRVDRMRSEFATIVQSAIIVASFRQAMAAGMSMRATPEHIRAVLETLATVGISEDSTSASELAATLATAGLPTHPALTPSAQRLLETLLTGALFNPSHQLHALLRKRCVAALECAVAQSEKMGRSPHSQFMVASSALSDVAIPDSMLTGIDMCAKELIGLGESIHAMSKHNWVVFSTLYLSFMN
ncbi:Tcp11-domain-containing protein [Ramicandelaber brevisporus]|nr:Tcp11-domain-containing protein [Ramicandelaber brevisporus]